MAMRRRQLGGIGGSSPLDGISFYRGPSGADPDQFSTGTVPPMNAAPIGGSVSLPASASVSPSPNPSITLPEDVRGDGGFGGPPAGRATGSSGVGMGSGSGYEGSSGRRQQSGGSTYIPANTPGFTSLGPGVTSMGPAGPVHPSTGPGGSGGGGGFGGVGGPFGGSGGGGLFGSFGGSEGGGGVPSGDFGSGGLFHTDSGDLWSEPGDSGNPNPNWDQAALNAYQQDAGFNGPSGGDFMTGAQQGMGGAGGLSLEDIAWLYGQVVPKVRPRQTA